MFGRTETKPLLEPFATLVSTIAPIILRWEAPIEVL